MKNLIFNNNEYELKEISLNGETLLCRCYENITYVSCPVSDIQKLSIYVAEAYYNGDHTVRRALFHGYVVCCAGIRGREMKDSSGTDVDIYYPWNTVHSGDYDLDELFLWVDDICKTY